MILKIKKLKQILSLFCFFSLISQKIEKFVVIGAKKQK